MPARSTPASVCRSSSVNEGECTNRARAPWRRCSGRNYWRADRRRSSEGSKLVSLLETGSSIENSCPPHASHAQGAGRGSCPRRSRPHGTQRQARLSASSNRRMSRPVCRPAEAPCPAPERPRPEPNGRKRREARGCPEAIRRRQIAHDVPREGRRPRRSWLKKSLSRANLDRGYSPEPRPAKQDEAAFERRTRPTVPALRIRANAARAWPARPTSRRSPSRASRRAAGCRARQHRRPRGRQFPAPPALRRPP